MPSYGVSIGERFAGCGLLKLSLTFVIAWCRLNEVGRVMLKVHPENWVAKRVYEGVGFCYAHTESPSGQLVYYLDMAR